MCYSRQDAFQDGTLVDVSDIADSLGILFPVAVSNAIYNHPGIVYETRHKMMERVIQMSLGSPQWLSGTEIGEFSFGTLLDCEDSCYPIDIRVVIEHSPDGDGVVATLLEARERLDLSGPAATFYQN